MTHLRKMMLEELQRRNFSEDTIRHYIHTVEDFARHFNRSTGSLRPAAHSRIPSPLVPEAEVIVGFRYEPPGGSALFLHTRRSRKPGASPRLPIRKRTITSQRSSARKKSHDSSMLRCTPFHRTLLMTLYATGLRRAELTHLKVSDIDSKRMVIHVHGGKGRKDRDVLLSPKLLEELREHWHRLRRKTSDWLFPGNRWHTANHPIDTKTPDACKEAAKRAGLKNQSIPTPCAIASPLICSRPALICAPFRSC